MALTIILATLTACSGGKKPEVDPTGTWKWNTANPDGQIPDITFTLKLQGGALTGTLTKSTGTAPITNGVLKGDEVSFQTVREGNSGTTTTTYSGKLSGDSLEGKVEIVAAGKTISEDWEAKRVKQ
jgi:hypothetical protein